jgi:hypothetical protein
MRQHLRHSSYAYGRIKGLQALAMNVPEIHVRKKNKMSYSISN